MTKKVHDVRNPDPAKLLKGSELNERIVFRRWRSADKTLIALFPDIRNGSYCGAFEHLGQHGDADYNKVLSLTVPVSDEGQDKIDKDELWQELKERGYHLKEIQRNNRKD